MDFIALVQGSLYFLKGVAAPTSARESSDYFTRDRAIPYNMPNVRTYILFQG